MSPLFLLWMATSSLPTPGSAALDRACSPVSAGDLAAGPCTLQLAPSRDDLLLARRGEPREPWGHYLGWGVADWVIAGSMWAGGAWLGILGSVLLFGSGSDARGVGAVMVAGGAALGIGGAFVAQHGAANLETYHKLRGR